MKIMIKEKKTGEMYSSKSAMKMHEKGESMRERMMEYGKPPVAKKTTPKSKKPMKAMKKK